MNRHRNCLHRYAVHIALPTLYNISFNDAPALNVLLVCVLAVFSFDPHRFHLLNGAASSQIILTLALRLYSKFDKCIPFEIVKIVAISIQFQLRLLTHPCLKWNNYRLNKAISTIYSCSLPTIPMQ